MDKCLLDGKGELFLQDSRKCSNEVADTLWDCGNSMVKTGTVCCDSGAMLPFMYLYTDQSS